MHFFCLTLYVLDVSVMLPFTGGVYLLVLLQRCGVCHWIRIRIPWLNLARIRLFHANRDCFLCWAAEIRLTCVSLACAIVCHGGDWGKASNPALCEPHSLCVWWSPSKPLNRVYLLPAQGASSFAGAIVAFNSLRNEFCVEWRFSGEATRTPTNHLDAFAPSTVAYFGNGNNSCRCSGSPSVASVLP